MEFAFVIRLDEVIQNTKQFNNDLINETDILSQLSRFRHWYDVPSLDMFGPSTFIGYKNMNTELYNRGRSKSGLKRKKFLSNGLLNFLKVVLERWNKFMSELISMPDLYGKKVNQEVTIHVLKNGLSISGKIDEWRFRFPSLHMGFRLREDNLK